MNGFESVFQALFSLLIGIAKLFIDFVVAVLNLIVGFLQSLT